MKKTLIIMSLLVALGLTSTFVFADNPISNIQLPRPNIEDRENWFKERMEWKNTRIEEALKEGIITEEEANTWKEHFSYMKKFHNENGFMPGCNGMGNWMGQNGFGRGMMRGNRWNR